MTVTEHMVITVAGPPRGQGRARSGQGRVYTPAATREATAHVQTEWIAHGRPRLPADRPYVMAIEAEYARPASHIKRDGTLSATGRRTPYPGKPDLDNIAKLALDSLVACGAIPDDRLLVSLTATKCWAPTGTPSLRIEAVAR